jgi:hypothetical protein
VKDEAAAREARAQAVPEAPPPDEAAAPAQTKTPKHQTYQPWKKSATNTHGFHRMSTPRKVGGS